MVHLCLEGEPNVILSNRYLLPLMCAVRTSQRHKRIFSSLTQHYTYKSWYSWLISNLANAVYTFGFISMCPQLYVNYRLKSVAHLPCKVFLYKVFNTFVDDVFAFLIDMPWKHRVMTLRDDVVFGVFLVQAYVYRVDKTRANEFGYSYENEETEHKEEGVAVGKDKID